MTYICILRPYKSNIYPGWIFEATEQYNVSFFVSGGFLLLAGLISCLVDLLKRKRDRSFKIETAMIIKWQYWYCSTPGWNNLELDLVSFFQIRSRRSRWGNCGLQLKMFESQTLIHKNKTSEKVNKVVDSFLRALKRSLKSYVSWSAIVQRSIHIAWPEVLLLWVVKFHRAKKVKPVPYEMCRKQYKIHYGVQPKCSIFNKSDHDTNWFQLVFW